MAVDVRDKGIAKAATQAEQALLRSRAAKVSVGKVPPASKLVEGVKLRPADISLYGGLAGIGWIAAHLDGPDWLLADYDDVLGMIAMHSRSLPLSLADGLTGIGVYALERLHRQKTDLTAVHQLLGAVVNSIVNEPWGVLDDCVCTMLRDRGHTGVWYEAGMSHGVAGRLAFLAAVSRMRKVSLALREGAIHGLRSQLPRLVKATRGGVPRFFNDDGVRLGHAGLGWATGQLGVAVALIAAGEATPDQKAIDHGQKLATSAQKRAALASQDETLYADKNLYDGAPGVAVLLTWGKRWDAPDFWDTLMDKLAKRPWPPDPIGCSRLLKGRVGVGLARSLGSAWNKRPAADASWRRVLLLGD